MWLFFLQSSWDLLVCVTLYSNWKISYFYRLHNLAPFMTVLLEILLILEKLFIFSESGATSGTSVLTATLVQGFPLVLLSALQFMSEDTLNSDLPQIFWWSVQYEWKKELFTKENSVTTWPSLCGSNLETVLWLPKLQWYFRHEEYSPLRPIPAVKQD